MAAAWTHSALRALRRPAPPAPPGYATLDEAAAVVGLAPRVLAGVVEDGYLPVSAVGGHRYVAVDDLVAYANRHARLHPDRPWVRALLESAAARRAPPDLLAECV